MVSEIRIGISGWRYGPWRKDFYPEGLRQDDELAFASRAVNSIEINGSFYALQTPERYAKWRDETPEGFVFSVKAPRYITHVRRLREIDEALANFFASGPLLLGDKLGPFLWQFPPNLKFDAQRFSDFLAKLPRDRKAARSLAHHAAERLQGNGGTAVPGNARLRHAVEIRHPSFLCDTFIDLLRKHKVALVVADSAGKWPYVEEVTAEFVYLRLHGDVELYSSGYTARALRRWRLRIQAWAAGSQPEDAQRVVRRAPAKRTSRDVYCYFDNDQKVHAPYDARRLLDKLGLDGELVTEAAGAAMNPTLPAPRCIIDKVTAVHRLTVLTLNVHKGFTLFNRRFILPELREAVRSTGADLVFLQEVHGTHHHHAERHPKWPQTPQYEFLADSMWPQFAYGRNAVYPHGDHGNALLSKFPIRAHDNLDVSVHGNEERGLLHCQLEVPGHEQVHTVCVHLGLREEHRQRQVGLLLTLLDSLPPDEPVIVAGDFNDWRLKADARLSGHLVEAFGKPARSFPARLPMLRLDRIYLRNAQACEARVLSRYPWSHLSDHAPLVAQVTL